MSESIQTKFRYGGPVINTSAGQVASLVVKAGPGTLFGLTVYNNAASMQWIQLHNAVSLPANTTVPVMTFEIAANTARSLAWGFFGRYFSTGIVVANSTTDVTLTTGAADCLIDAQYV